VATPADASLMRQLGAQAVFVGSGIFKSESPERYEKAIVKAATHYDNPEILVEVSTGLGAPMLGQSLGEIPPEERLATRGW
jgi:pyridoxal 5'-phosphate synthase pdxS subunit